MARGWESKSVESQIEEAEARRKRPEVELSPEEQQRLSELNSLYLNRIRISNDLARATHPRHRETLEAALKHLEERIAALAPPAS